MEVVKVILEFVVVAALAVATKYLASYLASKKQEIEETVSNMKLSDTLSRAINLIEGIVDTISQTYVDSLKNKGEFTKEAQVEAFDKAVDAAKQMIDQESLGILESAFGDIDAWLRIQIESYIKRQKAIT